MRTNSSYARRYIIQAVAMTVCLSAAAGIVGSLTQHLDSVLAPVAVSAAFAIVTAAATGMRWRRVADSQPEMLTTFFTSVSGFRMLAALFTLFICYLVVGREAMKPYIILFMVFYLFSLAHHSLFFSHINNKK